MEIRGDFRATLAIWVSGEITLGGSVGADWGQGGLEPGLRYRVGRN